MGFIRKNWYYLGAILFVALAFCVGFWGDEIAPLRKILLLSFMALLVQQFEEYAFPGGFSAVFTAVNPQPIKSARTASLCLLLRLSP